MSCNNVKLLFIALKFLSTRSHRRITCYEWRKKSPLSQCFLNNTIVWWNHYISDVTANCNDEQLTFLLWLYIVVKTSDRLCLPCAYDFFSTTYVMLLTLDSMYEENTGIGSNSLKAFLYKVACTLSIVMLCAIDTLRKIFVHLIKSIKLALISFHEEYM